MEKQAKNKAIAIFEGKQIRRHWDEEKELWYFSVIDMVMILTGSSIPRRYWSDLKNKLKTEGSQVYEKIVQLKFLKNGSLKIWKRTKLWCAKAEAWLVTCARILKLKPAKE